MEKTQPDMDIPSSWTRSAERILGNRLRKVLVLGASDSGKSTYCRFLCRALCSAGFPAAFVDADVGQKDVGPPCTISLARFTGGVNPAACRPERLYFVGGKSPVGRMLPMIVGTRHLVDAAHDPFVVINTTGLVQGPGKVLKAYKIESVRPDAVVCIERDRELEPLARAHRNETLIRVKASGLAAAKSREERIAAREEAFRSCFDGSKDRLLSLSEVVFQRFPLIFGNRIDAGGCLYAERHPENIVCVSDGEAPSFRRDMKVLPAGFERNLLCGVLDGRGEVTGLGLLNRLDFRNGTVSVWTPAAGKDIRTIQAGDLYLDRRGRELDGPANRPFARS